MDTFVDLRLLPDPEFPATILMNALFSKFHRGLVRFGEGGIGVSFPDTGEKIHSLGSRMRLHGNADTLRGFLESGWMQGMRDHVRIGSLAPVPSDVRYRIVRRVQAKSSPERLRRRLIARKGVSEAEAQQAIPDSAAETLALPFVLLQSQSTGQQFRLFIEHLPVQGQAQAGTFSAYGLSAEATIPWF